MPTLLLRIAGPLQSWGTDSKMDVRTTSREPSKSGIVGLVASALGRSREDSVDDITALKFGVRIDQEGTLLRDFQTVKAKNSYVTYRHYLQDAIFLVGLEGPEDFIRTIADAIHHPYYPLFLGRRSCPPTGQIVLGIKDCSLLEALSEEEWLASIWYRKKQFKTLHLEIVVDSDTSDDLMMVNDRPISFSQDRRMFGCRPVSRIINAVYVENEYGRIVHSQKTDHDVIAYLGGE